jgi:enolase-phosphatase E1
MSAVTSAVVLDIEGTVSPLAAVHDVLFPYARDRIEAWIRQGGEGTAEVADGVAAILGGPVDQRLLVRTLLGWHDDNVKFTPLKTLHGLIWEQGFLSGELRGEFYPDVPVALAEWHRREVPVWIYSSGSVLAQRLWFSRTNHGNLFGYVTGHFDTVSGGPKREPSSYRRIADAIDIRPGEIVFLSDSAAELDAARSAGWRTVGVRRPDCAQDVGTHPVVGSFAELDTVGIDVELAGMDVAAEVLR